jgi:hypothetical protein
MKNKNSSCNYFKSTYTKIIIQEIKFLTNKTRFIIILSLITALLLQTSVHQKVYAQITNLQKDPFSWEIKLGDIDPEFLLKWHYDFNPSPQQFLENNSQKKIRIIFLLQIKQFETTTKQQSLMQHSVYKIFTEENWETASHFPFTRQLLKYIKQPIWLHGIQQIKAALMQRTAVGFGKTF